jgi:hypothetical protein
MTELPLPTDSPIDLVPAEAGDTHPLPAEPTNATPGSVEKIAVFVARLTRGEAIFHPADRTLDNVPSTALADGGYPGHHNRLCRGPSVRVPRPAEQDRHAFAKPCWFGG